MDIALLLVLGGYTQSCLKPCSITSSDRPGLPDFLSPTLRLQRCPIGCNEMFCWHKRQCHCWPDPFWLLSCVPSFSLLKSCWSLQRKCSYSCSLPCTPHPSPSLSQVCPLHLVRRLHRVLILKSRYHCPKEFSSEDEQLLCHSTCLEDPLSVCITELNLKPDSKCS